MSLLQRLEKEKGSRQEGTNQTDKLKEVQKLPKDPYRDLKQQIHHKIIQQIDQKSMAELSQSENSAKLIEQIEEMASEYIDKEAGFISRADRQKIISEIIDEIMGFGPIR